MAPDRNIRYESIPIPSYDEAVSANGGYRPPTVESEDDSDDGDEVRREMQEMELVDDQDRLSWAKRLPFLLPRWNWRMPRMPRREDVDARRWIPSFPALSCFLISRLIGLVVVFGALYILFTSGIFSKIGRKLSGGSLFDPESLRIHIQSTISRQRMRDTLRDFTAFPHIAGSEGDYALALDTVKMFESYGLEDVTVDEYQVYLNYPRKDGRAVEIVDLNGKTTWTAKLEEELTQTFAFHGYSKSGTVKGPLIYANYGSRDDFKRLYDSGIATNGAIALVRYYGTQSDRALKVKAAELAGFAGCIMYSDPADDGFVKGPTAPKGRFMPADGVQRGSVGLSTWVLGDALTPGWESKNEPRIKPEESAALPKIPSLPLAWRDAQVLLQHLVGIGQPCPQWKGGVPDVGEWWTGNLSSPVVRLRNEQDEVERQPIWNVYARIVGTEQPEKTIIVGNHRDAWAAGATDPGSGTAVMMEVARVFGDLLARGWRPLRTIEFMSWDAEEYNLIGSTEFVEKRVDQLRRDNMVYLNVDGSVYGHEFHAAGSPVFQGPLMRVLDRVVDPFFNATLRDLWNRRNGQLEDLGAGSDYAAFHNIAGTCSLDISFTGEPHPYHSWYDNFEWMSTVGDPELVYHDLAAQVLALLVIDLADRPILPLDIAAYANSLEKWTDSLVEWSGHKGANQAGQAIFDLQVVKNSVKSVVEAMQQYLKFEPEWESQVVGANGWEPLGLGLKRLEYNSHMAGFETDLLDVAVGGGIPNRTQFRHVVSGPDLWSGYDGTHFPAIRDVVEAGDWVLANTTVEKTAAILRGAAENLIAWMDKA